MKRKCILCHLAASQLTNMEFFEWRVECTEERISIVFQETPHTTELKTVSAIIANNPFRRKFTPLHMGVNVSFLTLELSVP